MGKNRLWKRILVYLMTFMMVFSTMSTSVFAAPEDGTDDKKNQIGNYYEVYDDTGALKTTPLLGANQTVQNYADGKVKVNKTIAPGGAENVFDITLDVETTQDLEKITRSTDALAVIVLDASLSMEYCINCNHSNHKSSSYNCSESKCDCKKENYKSRVSSAKEAAQAFINEFARTGENAKRYIAIVGFSGIISGQFPGYSAVDGAVRLADWNTADSFATENDQTYREAIQNYEANGGTNIHAGLMLANNLLNNLPDEAKGIDSKNVVVISDGAPTYSVNLDTIPDDELKRTDKICEGGKYMEGSGSTTTAINCEQHRLVEELSASMKRDNISMYAAYLGSDELICSGEGNASCYLTEDGKKGSAWLSTSCGIETYEGNSIDLVDKFRGIVQIIEKNAQAWSVIDPMGPYIEFIKPNSEGLAEGEVSFANNELFWDLKRATDIDPSDNNYKYSLEYKVKLNNLSKYVSDNLTNTNDITKLNYVVTTSVDNVQTSQENGTAYFNIPSVKGFEGEYEFIKKDSEGNALDEATFTLTTEDDPNWSMTATSDENGKVKFSKIPSGHTYKLKETVAPVNHKLSETEYELNVSYGKVTINGFEDPITVINEKIPLVNVVGEKKWVDNGSSTRDDFTVSLFGEYKDNGENYYLYRNNGNISATTSKTAYRTTSSTSWRWEGLPGVYNGKTVDWYVEETKIPEGYTPVVNGWDITNILLSDTDYVGQKIWSGDEASNRPDPNDMDIALYKLVGDQEVLVSTDIDWVETGGDSWVFKFEDIDLYDDNGNAIQYFAKERTVPTGYIHTIPDMRKIEYPVKGDTIATINYSSQKTTYSGTQPFTFNSGKVGFIIGAKDDTNSSSTYRYSIWTTEELSEAEKMAVIKNVPSNYSGITLAKTEFKFGTNKTFYREGNTSRTATVSFNNTNGQVAFNNNSNSSRVWSSWYSGSIEFSNEYEPGTTVLTNTRNDITDTKFVDATVIKVDNNKVTLEGAEFALYDNKDCEGSAIKSYTSGADGKIIISAEDISEEYRPSVGETTTLYLKETTAPTGYETSETVYSVTISTQKSDNVFNSDRNAYVTTTTYTVKINGVDKIDVTNTKKTDVETVPGEATVRKVDENNAALSGAEFGLFASKKDEEAFKTYEGGEFKISTDATELAAYLPKAGESATLYLKETKAPDGYEAETSWHEVVISASANEELTDGVFVTTTTYTVEIDDAEELSVPNTKKTGTDRVDDSVAVTKVDQNGKELEGAEFTLYDGTEAVETFSGAKFNISTKNLNGFLPEAGAEKTYTLKETKVPEGYEAAADREVKVSASAKEELKDGIFVTTTTYTITIDGSETATIENTKKTGTDRVDNSVAVTKVDQNGKELEGAEFTLYDGTEAVETFSGAKFNISTKNLNGFLPEAGAEKTYTLKETKVPEGYEAAADREVKVSASAKEELKDGIFVTTTTYTITIDGEETATITNTKKTGTDRVDDSVAVTKVDQAGKELAGAEFGLFASKEAEEAVKTYEGGKFTISTAAKALANYLPEAGESATLYLKETKAPDGYEAEASWHEIVISASANEKLIDGVFVTTTTYTITIDESDSAEIVNTAITSVSVNKQWDDNKSNKRPVSVQVQLLANENAVGEPVTLNADNDWSYNWNGLVKYDESNDEIVYKVKEVEVPDGYVAQIRGNNGAFTITNVEKTSSTITKIWNDANNHEKKRPTALEVTLSAIVGDEVTVVKTIELSEESGWTYTENGLPKYKNGVEITYKWTENFENLPPNYGMTGYETTREGNVITNTYPIQTMTISGQKSWSKDSTDLSLRPDEVTIKLLRDGKLVATTTAKKENNWKYTFTNLAEYDENGKDYKYTVDEVTVPGYDKVVTGNDIENSLRLTVEDDKHNSITINKTDGKEIIEGAKFVLKDGDTEVETYSDGSFVISTSDNKIKELMPEPGKTKELTLVETEAPAGYQKSDKEYNVVLGTVVAYKLNTDKNIYEKTTKYTISIDDKAEINVPNTKKTGTDRVDDAVTVNKVDQDEAALAGAEFGLFASKNAEEAVKTYSGESFEISTADTALATYLPAVGEKTTLYLKETKAPQGYDADSSWHDVVISASAKEELTDGIFVTTTTYTITIDGKVSADVVNNIRTGNDADYNSLIVNKVDKDGGKALPNAEFTLYSDNDCKETDAIKTYRADENGKIVISTVDLVESTLPEAGKTKVFHLKETKAPIGYELSDTVYEVVVDAVNGEPEYNADKNAFITTTTYTAKINGEIKYEVENDLILTEATIKKVWDDAENQDGIRPPSITVTLSDGTEVTLNEENDWTATVEDLPKYADGEEIEYTWEEDATEGYKLTDTSVNGTVTKITNTHIPETTEATVVKVWNDAGNQDGNRPAELTVTLSNGTEVVLNADNGWTAKVDNLPKYEAGEEIEYTWTEEKLPEGYVLTSTSKDGTITTLTNTYEPKVTTATIKKVWNDAENQDGIRPASLTVTLSNGTEVTLNEANEWTATVENLPVYKNGGQVIEYTWSEGEMPDGYELTSTSVNGTITTLTNTHTPELTEATIQKVWDDAENQDGKRPESLTVTLSNGTAVTLSEDNEWAATVENLPKYKDGGVEIVYTWTEGKMPEGYTLTNTAKEGTVTTLTNSYTPEETEATIQKVWDDADDQDGKRPESLTVTLSDGTEVVLNADNNWTAKVENLPKYADGEEIEYTWEEGEMPEGYTLTNTAKEGTVTTLTNSYTPELTEATIQKVWDDAENQDGKRPESLTVTLSNGTEVVLNEENEWSATVTDLPKFKDGGVEIEYTWTEGKLPEGYELTDTSVDGTVTTLTNTHVPELTEATIQKIWNDAENQDGKRPDELTVTLSNGTEVVLNEENEWSVTVTDLPKYEAGEVIEYTWTEGNMPEGYELTDTSVDGTVTTLTNTYEPEVMAVTIQKVWDDANDQDGKRPESLTVTLSNGTEVVLNADNEWTAKVENLPVYKDGGQVIEYTWTEGDIPEGYTLTDTSVNGTITTLTNSYTPEETEATIKKVWDDADDQDGKRPESLVATLSNGTAVTLNEENGWTAKVENLPKFKDGGVEIEYTWTEGDMPEGYELTDTSVDGTVTTLTNSHTPEETEAIVTKVWDDADNQDGIRPAELTVTLSNGTEVVLNAENEWTATVENLPKYKDGGVEIEYSWTEASVEGYELTGNSKEGKVTTLTNTHAPAVTVATVKKVWDDADNQDGIRPAELTVTLNNGTEVILNEANAWSATVTDLPKYKDGGVEIEYSWTETSVEGYELTDTSAEGTVTTLTNTHTPEETEATVTKVWDDADNQDGKRPAELTVTLSNGTEVTLNEANGWTATVEKLPKYEDGGKEIVYTWTEGEMPEGYELTATSSEGTVTTLTNSYKPEVREATVTKIWDDADNQDGIRPAELTVTLSNGTEDVKTVTLNADNQWSATVENLPVYKAGEKVVYTWTEASVEDYELTDTAENGTITLLTNSHVPETTELTVYKNWKDKHDKYEKRPAEITVYLYANGELVQTVQITEDDKWRHTFSELPKYADGEEIVYTISEKPVDGYITEIEDMTITNTINPEEYDDFADTGDDSNPWAYGFTAMMAMLTSAGALFFRRKED